jgi:hypothetical protein
LEHSHRICSVIICLLLLLQWQSWWVVVTDHIDPKSKKCLLSGPLQKDFVNPWTKGKTIHHRGHNFPRASIDGLPWKESPEVTGRIFHVCACPHPVYWRECMNSNSYSEMSGILRWNP